LLFIEKDFVAKSKLRTLVKEEHNKVIGLITPGAPKRSPSWQLRKYASFSKVIRPWAMQKSLLPNPIPNTEITKPKSW